MGTSSFFGGKSACGAAYLNSEIKNKKAHRLVNDGPLNPGFA
jgi:hypothetical protein